MTADKRSVATDAIETLGTIIDERAGRDAIHLAVEPVVAGESLKPGDDVSIKDGQAMLAFGPDSNAPVGIVDPFLRIGVEPGDRFWLVVYPRTITSLRHVWTHPAFPEEQKNDAKQTTVRNTKAKSEAWLRNFIARSDCPTYEDVIAAAVDPPEFWSDDYLHFHGQDAHGSIPPEFWDHVEIVTGLRCRKRPSYFSCSC
jgi:hypothetical protein